MTIKKQSNRGFGLLEVLVASGILIIVISASVSLSKMVIRNSVISLERVQAYNLAQEGMEKIRQIRDTSWIDGNLATDWDSNLDILPEIINLDGKQFTRTVSVESPETKVNDFLATNNIPNTENETLKKVRIVVSWQEYELDWQVEAASYLSNWKPGY